MLSQSEIDALLAGTIEIDQKDGLNSINLASLMNETEPQPKAKVSTYNFWSPDRFSKEQIRAVEMIHEDLAERLTTSLPTFLRTNLRPRLVHLEQGRFNEFLKDFPTNALYHMITLAPLPAQMLVTLSHNISHMVLEQRLGGRIDGKIDERPLTDIDQSLLRGLVEHMQGDIKAAWSKVVSIEPVLEDSTTNQHWVQMVMGNERTLVLTFEISIQSVVGTMSIFVPFSTLKPIANELNPHLWIAGRKEQQLDPAARETAITNLSSVPLSVRALLGETNLNISEILNLQTGDVIPLSTLVTQDVKIQVANQKRFSARIGKVGNRLGVQVTGVLHDDSLISALMK